MIFRSLRWRLIAASFLIQLIMLFVLVLNSHRIMHSELDEQAQKYIQQLKPLFNASVAGPLAARDLATLEELLNASTDSRGINYLVLKDHSGAIVAAKGWDKTQPLPTETKRIHDRHGENGEHPEVYNNNMPVMLAGQQYGTLFFGISLAAIRSAESSLLRQSMLIAAIAVVLSISLLAFAGVWLTRNLSILKDAAHKMTAGDLAQSVTVTGKDEVAELAVAFNTMATSVRQHTEKLHNSEDNYRSLAAMAQEEQGRMSSLLSAMNIGILFEDSEGRILYVNPALARIWRLDQSVALEGQPISTLLTKSPNVLSRPDHFSRHILQITSTHEVSESFEITLADGRVLAQLTYPVRDTDNHIIGRLWIFEDVTRERRTAEQLIYLAERDSLTGLFNRHRFQDELGRMLATGERFDRQGALLFFDLDEFKHVNDTYGHRAGDAMLIRVAGELGILIRRNEVLARLGGDEFAVLIPEASEAEACALAERIVRSIAHLPFRIEGQNLRLTASVGIAIYPLHGRNAEEIISHADAAMYQAKDAGKNGWRVYRPELDLSRAHVSRMSWQDRISRALATDQLRLHFQGVYNTNGGALSHVEALVRMVDFEDPERLIMPGHFINVAEQSGQIVDIDRWVIEQAAVKLAAHPHLTAVAVNVSGRSFDVPGLPDEIAAILARHEVDPRRLIVELTETAAVSDLHDASRFIEELHRAGCSVCLDDFGTGFSSFAYLKRLQVDTLKIDGMFIRDLPNDHDNQVLVRAIADVAHGLNKTTVAEYVEDAETAQMLAEFGVDMVQGYHLDIPVSDHPCFLNLPASSGEE